METEEYISRLLKVGISATLYMCEYCGVETISTTNMCMCSNCESIVSNTRALIEKRDNLLLNDLDSINRSVSAMKYEDAISIYQRLIDERKDPSLMYVSAITHLKYSNYQIMQIGYTKTGFMDENATYRNNAASLASKAKKLLTKAISAAKSDSAQGHNSLNLTYNKFLCQTKMNSLRGAKNSTGMLEKMDNEYVLNYAQMVFESASAKYDKVLMIAEKFTTKETFSINAFYYMGFALFKLKRIKEAKSVLDELKKILNSNNLDALLFEVNAQLSIY
jgi:tetratricopeptide (TPR) repeat protein